MLVLGIVPGPLEEQQELLAPSHLSSPKTGVVVVIVILEGPQGKEAPGQTLWSETHWHVTEALVDGWVFRGLSHLAISPFWKVLYSLLSLTLAMKLTRPQAWGMQPQFLLFLVFSPSSYSAASAPLWHPECIVLKCGNCPGAG